MAVIHLADETATLELGKQLATILCAITPVQTILLCGGLGAGKTTLVRGLIKYLPGGENAQVASPSFNIMNLYPTTPETAHFDLYRLEGLPPDESLSELLQQRKHLILIEWAQFLPQTFTPETYIKLTWHETQDTTKGRTLDITSQGKDIPLLLPAYTQEKNMA